MDMLGPIILLFVAGIIVLPWIAYKVLRPLSPGVRLVAALPVILSPYWIGNSYELSIQTIITLLPWAVMLALGAFWSLLPQWWIDNVTTGLRSPSIYIDPDYWDRRR